MARTKLQTASRTPLEVGKRIDDLVSKEETAKLVSCFFESAGPFAGSTFVTLQPVKKFQLTASDLVATSLLDIRFGPNAVRGILEDDATELAGLLKEVKPDVDLWDNRAPLTQAETLWDRLRRYPGVGKVTAKAPRSQATSPDPCRGSNCDQGS